MSDFSFINRRLRLCSRLLENATKWQREAYLEDRLKLGSLTTHLRLIADLLEQQGIEAAAAAHRDFAVIPHAAWLARRPRARNNQSSYRIAGRKGGASKSELKILASRKNGLLGGRPRFNDEPFIARFVAWAQDLKADPNYSEEVAAAALRSFPTLSVRLRRKIKRQLRARGISITNVLGKDTH